jgi:amino acid transporter
VAVNDVVKRLFLGRALRSDRLNETLLPKRIALPVFASDALSSNAYATQEILLVLSLGGVSFLAFGPWIAVAVVVLYFTVIASYRQTVRAYPNGGGDYEVVKENIGQRPGVFVASALLIDYVLTVSVSISAAVANLGSTVPFIGQNPVFFSVGIIVVVALLNMRGLRESGSLFAVPTYFFIATIFIMIGTAIVRMLLGHEMLAESASWTIVETSAFSGLALAFLLARSFAAGTTALTGIEAVANGVPAFREPKSKNAAQTLLLLGALSMAMFSGITWLAIETQVKVTEANESLIGLPEGSLQKTVLVQVAGAVFDNVGWLVLIVSISTAAILALAANTAFNGFPILGSILARDGFLPRQLHTRGDRLAYSNGILVLALLAGLLVVVFQADVTALIQLYIIGVFIAFSMGQWGMVRHWNRALRKEQDPRLIRKMKRSRFINAFGLSLTSIVLIIVLVAKFSRGAWVIVVAIPLVYFLMVAINKHYSKVRRELATSETDRMVLPTRVHVLVLVSKIHKPTLRALAYARATRPTVLEAITVDVDEGETAELADEWERRSIPVALKILASPYREVTRPVLEYVTSLRSDNPNDLVTIFIPQYVVGHWWEQLLHNQSALRLKARLMFMPGVMVTTVPWPLASSDYLADRPE